MPLFNWSPDFSVGIAAMDEEHRKLIDLINRLFDAMKEGRGRDVMEPVFTGLVEYTQTHFSDEEALMARYEYPGLAAQKEEHRLLVQSVSDKYQKFKSGSLMISIELMNFLRDWLTNHIMKSDRLYGEFLNRKGVQ